MRLVLRIVLGLAVIYALILGWLLAAMYQPPATFANIMAQLPGPALRVLPFRPLWFLARAGQLQAGDPAPDFDLETVDKKSRVRLSSLRGDRPVILVFGSYT